MTFCLSLLTTVTAIYAADVRLSYQGYPYKRTTCAPPVYAAGSVITLPDVRLKNAEGRELIGWAYNGETYQPGASFTLPETDVELVPVWKQPDQGAEQVQSDKVQSTKVMENGVLYLLYKGTKYNVQGQKVNEEY